jgi:uracil-DNA glycosylase
MNRNEILGAIRRIMSDEKRHGIGYWCDAELASAIQGTISAARAGAPAALKKDIAGDGTKRRLWDAVTASAQTSRPAAVSPAPAGSRVRAGDTALPGVGAQAENRARAGQTAPVAPASWVKAAAHSYLPVWGPPPQATGRDHDWQEKLGKLDAEVKRCKKCGLCEERTKTVFGSGDASVPLVFVGEAPGADEDRQGLPFVGRAGELLTRIIAAMGLSREQVYICNVLKCRPPANRDPLPDEVAACTGLLERQLEILQPKVICALGRHSAAFLTGAEGVAMKEIRGRTFTYRGMQVVPTYHPAALLRNPALKPMVWEDVQKIRALLDSPARGA